MILKLLGAEIDIGSTAIAVANSTLVRVINTGAAAVLNVQYSNGTVYANTTVSNVEYVVIEKAATDKLVGTGLKATPVAYKY